MEDLRCVDGISWRGTGTMPGLTHLEAGVTDRSGCGLAMLTVLRLPVSFRAGRGGEAGSADVLDEVDRRIGLGPGYAYPMVCDLVAPGWSR